ncbi:MAG: hypothetical protein H7301_05020 [Cryobacterium sp.]|nr:hypothetical protein [Oligoflexia bacterium]
MGYVIKALPKNKTRKWKLQHVSYAGDVSKTTDIPEKNMPGIGFSPDMTIEQARVRRDQINAQEHLKRQESRRVKIIEKLLHEELVQDAFLPSALVKDFEENHLFERMDKESAKRNKVASHWRAAKRVLCKLQLDGSEWYERRGRFYDFFSSQAFSPSYVQKIITLVNRWGRYEARKSKRFFEPLPLPTHKELQTIADAYFDENDGESFESAPLTPKMLESKRSAIDSELADWLFLSVWLGLRPSEVDLMAKPTGKSTWWTDSDDKGVEILYVYQPKLKSIARPKRVKAIPILFPEQTACLKIIRDGKFRRPLAKTTKHHFGPNVTTYGGRKGFTDLMLSKGQDFIHISRWLGHTTVDRTLKNYKDKLIANYTLPSKDAA